MDLKPVRGRVLWWCEYVGVHLLQTHRRLRAKEARAFHSRLNQTVRKRKDRETIRSPATKNCKGSAAKRVEIQISPCGKTLWHIQSMKGTQVLILTGIIFQNYSLCNLSRTLAFIESCTILCCEKSPDPQFKHYQ